MLRLGTSIGPSSQQTLVTSEEVEGSTSEASFWQQLKATTIRNLLRKKRNKRQAFRETFTPCYYLVLIVVMKYAIPNPTFPAISQPLGSSSLFEFPAGKNQTIGVVPDDQVTRNFMNKTLSSKFLAVCPIFQFLSK